MQTETPPSPGQVKAADRRSLESSERGGLVNVEDFITCPQW